MTDPFEKMTGAERAEYHQLEMANDRRRAASRHHLVEMQTVQVIAGDRVLKMQVWKIDDNKVTLRGLPE
jgi:hypothetical protein